jgi:hypothetical protein
VVNGQTVAAARAAAEAERARPEALGDQGATIR